MHFLHQPRFIAAMRTAFWLALVFAVVMALLPSPPQLPTDRFGDKVQHMLAFATLALLAAAAYPAAPRWRVAERLSFLGAMIEVAQSIPALGRDCQFSDWVADTLVIVAVTAIVALVQW